MSKARKPDGELRRGWTTGACATAAAKAAWHALQGKGFPDPVQIRLPRGETPAFALARTAEGDGWARATVVKDAGDDPDVTHGAEISATVRRGQPGTGVAFKAGPGVGTVTRPGLPIPPGEPAINPVPRKMMREAVEDVSAELGIAPDAEIEISVTGGAALAEKTWNPRLGIVGGISILGTTGIVVPYSCAAWIHSIHRGIDVARACGLNQIAASTGSTSEAAVQKMYALPETALIDMGDFVGGTLKYVKTHPVARVTLAGGVGKMTKLAQGLLDLHSKRGSIDLDMLSELAARAGGSEAVRARIRASNTAAEAFGHARAAGIALGDAVASAAQRTAAAVVAGAPVQIEVVVFDREGELVGKASSHAVPPR